MKKRSNILIAIILLTMRIVPAQAAQNNIKVRPIKTNIQENRPSITPGIRQNEVKNEANKPSITPGIRQNEVKNMANENRPQEATRSCEARVDSVARRTDNLIKFVDNVINTFDKITTRVKDYYVQNVQANSPIDNYDTLLADINAKKVVAQDTLIKSQDLVADFDCNSDDIQTTLQEFNTQMKDVKAALQEYRTAIKNLIVAVHSQSDSTDTN